MSRIAGLTCAAFLLGAPVQAASLCERLYERLAELPQERHDASQPSGFTGDITRLNLELRAARADLRRLNCTGGSITVIGGGSEAACDALNERIVGLGRDIDAMKAQRLSAPEGGEAGQRQRILNAIDLNRCAEKMEAEPVPISAGEDEQRPFRQPLYPPVQDGTRPIDGFGETPPLRLHDRRNPGWGGAGSGFSGSDAAGTVRTLCVRTCDGAFFPISSQATPEDFARDAESCHQRCPGAPTALYYHSLETQEADEMVSAETGAPYRDLPTAFAYKLRDPSEKSICGCQLNAASVPSQSEPGDPGKSGEPGQPGASSIVSITTRPPAAGASDNGMPVRDGAMPQPEAAAAPAQAQPSDPARPYDPARKVRQVGPSFLPAQESAIDLHQPKSVTPSPDTN
ncbi:hypothetical protein BTR14_01540 [Rhizobium rhizosphaerae]|uniref:DUF2865 domain-containing protein n=1 Tax=Xaviernesmea rhizosphaerae TaxID=1672749 RepID=A0ABX3PJR1_9HYPH|nr:hypothetical protein BTR14_01540 [Xaviernesmea rhizosphaerae]